MVKQTEGRWWESLFYNDNEYPCRIINGINGTAWLVGSYALENVLRPLRDTDDEEDFDNDEAEQLYQRFIGFVYKDDLYNKDNDALVKLLLASDCSLFTKFVNGNFSIIHYDNDYAVRHFKGEDGHICNIGCDRLLKSLRDGNYRFFDEDAKRINAGIHCYISNEAMLLDDEELLPIVEKKLGIKLCPII